MTGIMINNSEEWPKVVKNFVEEGNIDARIQMGYIVRESGNKPGNYLLQQNTSISLNYSNFEPQSNTHLFWASFFSFTPSSTTHAYANINILLNTNECNCDLECVSKNKNERIKINE